MRWLIGILLILGHYARAMELTFSPSERGGNGTLIVNGEIGPKDAAALAKILNPRAEAGKRTLILLTSHGGALEVIPEVGEALLKASNTLYKKHKVSNFLAINDECTSACTNLTAYLTKKRDPKALEMFIDPKATFGIHGPKGGEVKENKQIAAYVAHGVSIPWLTRNDANLRRPRITEFKAEVLCAERTMIIPPDSCQPKAAIDLVESLEARLNIVRFGP